MKTVTIAILGKKRQKPHAWFNAEAIKSFSLIGKQIAWGYDRESDVLAFKEIGIGREIKPTRSLVAECSIFKNFAKQVIGKWEIKQSGDTYLCYRVPEDLCYRVPEESKTLVGKRFGRLEVEEFWGSKRGKRLWSCRCDCGNKTVVPTGKLTNGATKSCGCLKNEKYNNRKNNVLYTVDGELLSLAEISRRYNIKYSTLAARLNKHQISIEDAINK